MTVLTFSPEREPFRTWENRGWFWARLVPLPAELLIEGRSPAGRGVGIDGFFGAMLDSRQVRKLPVAALLLLLVVYLGVIGPFDQWILRRTGRQMWTWVTFPVYVVLFSGMIYYIGYRLRAGVLEWNELQVVDQLSMREQSPLRGRTWVSIYSPANARYRIASEQPFGTIRSEFEPSGSARGGNRQLHVRYPVRGFEASAFVPVWINQVYVSDWFQAGGPLLRGSLESGTNSPGLRLSNQASFDFESVTVVYSDRIFELGALKAGESVQRPLEIASGKPVDELLASVYPALTTARQRGSAFGREGSGQWERNIQGVMLASLSQSASAGERFLVPPGLDLSTQARRGEALVFAWASGQEVASAIHRFSPKRMARDTVVRLVLPAPSSD